MRTPLSGPTVQENKNKTNFSFRLVAKLKKI